MKETRKEVVVLKLGGSIVTYKSSDKVKVRKKLLKQIADEIKSALKDNPSIQLLLVHGAGSAGHVLAKKFDLKSGVKGDLKKLQGALKIRENNQFLNLEILKIFSGAGLAVSSLHSGSSIIQNSDQITFFDSRLVEKSLENGCIPLMYGEMVFDEKLGMSVCSGDNIATHLANIFSASKIIYASDIDGIYDVDPYLNKKAKLIKEVKLNKIEADISGSHNLDITGGLANKVNLIKEICGNKKLKEVIIFNGFKKENFINILSGETENSTVIRI